MGVDFVGGSISEKIMQVVPPCQGLILLAANPGFRRTQACSSTLGFAVPRLQRFILLSARILMIIAPGTISAVILRSWSALFHYQR